MATVTWIGLGTGAWEIGANWSTGIVPTAADDAFINTSQAVIQRLADFNDDGIVEVVRRIDAGDGRDRDTAVSHGLILRG